MTEFALLPLVAGIDIDPKESRLPKKDGTIVSNSLATFAYIRGRKMRDWFIRLWHFGRSREGEDHLRRSQLEIPYL